VLSAVVRRIGLVTAVLCLSATPAQASPRAIDFERSLSSGKARAAATVVAPGRPFDVVGLRWKSAPDDPHVELRVRAGGRCLAGRAAARG